MRWWNVNPRIKEVAATASLLAYKCIDSPVVVASTGRSGSTMLCHAVMNSMLRSRRGGRFHPRLVFFPAFDRERIKLHDGAVHKTHLLAHHFPSSSKCIFIYDDPNISKQSFVDCCAKYGREWGEQHLKNLESPYGVNASGEHDVLNYKNQINSWYNRKQCLIVRYNKVWEYQDEISDFLGLSVCLPPRLERATKGSSVGGLMIDELSLLYQELPEFVINE
tara:strand:- start:2482 stop:3144 length:663 start_codon:yes stop_codon:yes gene_type:complete